MLISEGISKSAYKNNTALYIIRRVLKVFRKLLQNVRPIMYDANDTRQHATQKRRQRQRGGVEETGAVENFNRGTLWIARLSCVFAPTCPLPPLPFHAHVSIESLFRTKDFRNEMIIDEVSDPLLYF